MSVGEILAEAIAIEPPGAGFAAEDAADEVDLAIVGVQGDRLVVEALVQIVAVLVLEVADGLRVLELADLRGKLFDFLFEGAELFISGHEGPFLKRAIEMSGPSTCPQRELVNRHRNYIRAGWLLVVRSWLLVAGEV